MSEMDIQLRNAQWTILLAVFTLIAVGSLLLLGVVGVGWQGYIPFLSLFAFSLSYGVARLHHFHVKPWSRVLLVVDWGLFMVGVLALLVSAYFKQLSLLELLALLNTGILSAAASHKIPNSGRF